MDCAANALVRSASADVARHSGVDVLVGWFGFSCKQCGRGHQLSRLAVSALWNLFGDPCLLQRVARRGRKSLDRRNFLGADARYGDAAGTRRRTVEMDGAGST